MFTYPVSLARLWSSLRGKDGDRNQQKKNEQYKVCKYCLGAKTWTIKV